MKSKLSGRMKIIWVMILIGFCAIEFPGILIVGKMARPFVFGLPFLYAYMIFWWLYLCIVIFFAYRENWGRNPR